MLTYRMTIKKTKYAIREFPPLPHESFRVVLYT
jgi:hypothetical protein